jgi:hypothetical protein
MGLGRGRAPLLAAVTVALASSGLMSAPAPAQAAPAVLLVGPWGTPNAQYSSIQTAVDHANPGDWILIAPGVYHEKGYSPTDGSRPAEVNITTPNLHLRGMSRTGVIVDGTDYTSCPPGAPSGSRACHTAPAGSPACSSDPSAQDPGVRDVHGNLHLREGIQVTKAAGVSIENLTSCNSLDNEIWWNNGDGGGVERPLPLHGDYITATSTFYKDAGSPSAQYGIFTSDVSGPSAGTGVVVSIIDHSYANNMTDSAYYIGACRNCYQILDHAHAENSALGLSSTNAGGNLLIENGEWDLNRTGLVSNAQNNDDWPSPEYGQCVDTPPPPGAGPNSCYVMRGNLIHDNNNPNTPGVGLTAVSAVGTGVELAATQHISVIDNRIYNQGAWGVVAHDFPDPETGPAGCQGGVPVPNPAQLVCYFFSRGNYVSANHFTNDGFFGNLTNGDIANQAAGLLDASACPRNATACVPQTGPGHIDPNCFTGNHLSSPTAEWPPLMQETGCHLSETAVLTAQLLCATGATSLFTSGVQSLPAPPACPTGAGYPQHDGNCQSPAVLTPPGDTVNGVCFLPLSYTLSTAVSPTMPNPCAGVPANAYCTTTAGALGTGGAVVPTTGSAGATVSGAAGPTALDAAAEPFRHRARAI